jgi:hypothetical protein
MFKLTVITLTIALAAIAVEAQPTLRIVEPDGPNLPAELFYGNVKVKPLRLRPGTNQVITIDDTDFFVDQAYVDFLNRFPDASGFGYWMSQITGCGSDQACIFNKRIDVSNAFFFEQEYQQTAAYAYRLYRVTYGNNQPFPNPDGSNLTESKKIPSFAAFKPDRAAVIGSSNLAQAQLDLANAFVLRPEFVAKYPASLSTAAQFVDAVLVTIQNDLGANLSSERTNLINLYGTLGRGGVIYRLADDNASNPISNSPLINAEYNRAFVYSQYSGYLRRDSDIGGFLFWLGQVNSGPLRDVNKQHAMVCSFITSDEWQLRFGNAVTHHNSECPH